MLDRFAISRRGLLAAAGAAGVSALAPGSRALAQAGRGLTLSDAGGQITVANNETLYEPFRKETGLRLTVVAREHEPISQVKAMVESKSYVWDVTALTKAQGLAVIQENLLEPLDWSDPHMAELIPAAKHSHWMAHSTYAAVLGYRSDRYGTKPPRSWADFWNVKDFPGRRALRKHPIETLEIALMADGVPIDKIYPIDMKRAFASLDRIKPHIHVWWTGGAQSVQLLQSDEVQMLPIWSARLQQMIDAGGKGATCWNQGIYAADGWGILKGTPRLAEARRLVNFMARPDRQAARATLLGNGPTNPKALDAIPADRARLLPTYPDNLNVMLASDDDWWIANRDEAIERFNAWILS
ncbi:MAG: ABC transporter substrate-binding protein [Alphaproteobacteria bacterium]